MIYVCNIAGRPILGVNFSLWKLFVEGVEFFAMGGILSLWCVIRVPNGWGLDFGTGNSFTAK